MKLKNFTLLFIFLAILVCRSAYAQTPNVQIPLSYQFNQKLNGPVYSPNTKFHSSIRGYLADDSLLTETYSKLMNMGVDTSVSRSWARRKLTQEHLLDVKGENYTVFADIIPDFQIGRDFSSSEGTWLNTRGYQVGGTVGKQVSFYTSGYENQGVFARYYQDYIDSTNVMPGQLGGGPKLLPRKKDWSYVTALISYTPNKHLNIALGYDKNFIGDGYRSMLLSDNASNYSFLRLRATLGSVQYQTIFAYMLDPGAERLTADRRLGNRGKWMAAHYLDWNATNRFSIGFFQAVVWSDAEEEGRRGFDFNFIHPFIFLRPVESANTSSPDKMRLGLNAKYEILDKTALYGQFMLEEFVADHFFSGDGYWANKFAWQLGVKGSDLFKLPGLNYLLEFNAARPYAYSHFTRITNYSHYNQPLAHPFGANFREVIGILNYSYKRFNFQGELLRATYGLDSAGSNYGKDIFLSYNTRESDFGNSIGQGVKTNLYYAEAKVAYLLNPKTNLRIEAGAIARRESNALFARNTSWLTIGLRGSFRNLYTDF